MNESKASFKLGLVMNKFVVMVLLLWLGMGVNAQDFKNYQIKFNINNMHCSFFLNDMFLFTTIGEYEVPRDITFGYMMGEGLAPGVNTLTVAATDIRTFENLPENIEGHCEVTLSGVTKDHATVLISRVKAVYDADKKLSFIPADQTVLQEYKTNQPFISKNSLFEAKIDGNSIYLPRIDGTLSFLIDQKTNMSWVKATPFKDTPENRQKLWTKYNDIRAALQKCDKSTIRQQLEPGVTEKANYDGLSAYSHFSGQMDMVLTPFLGLKESAWQKVNLDDYDLRIYADGRLFQLVKKAGLSGSPIQIMTTQSNAFNPVFTYINGEIVVAWF